jgi:hypothetical protein
MVEVATPPLFLSFSPPPLLPPPPNLPQTHTKLRTRFKCLPLCERTKTWTPQEEEKRWRLVVTSFLTYKSQRHLQVAAFSHSLNKRNKSDNIIKTTGTSMWSKRVKEFLYPTCSRNVWKSHSRWQCQYFTTACARKCTAQTWRMVSRVKGTVGPLEINRLPQRL